GICYCANRSSVPAISTPNNLRIWGSGVRISSGAPITERFQCDTPDSQLLEFPKGRLATNWQPACGSSAARGGLIKGLQCCAGLRKRVTDPLFLFFCELRPDPVLRRQQMLNGV